MKIIQLTQGKEALVSDEDYDYLNQWKWYAIKSRRTYYVRRTSFNINEKQNRIQIQMHNEVAKRMGLIGLIDHTDRNGLNDQRNNLRIANKSQNKANGDIYSNNTSGYKGVIWNQRDNNWRAQISFNKANHTLGSFDTKEEAALAYNRAAIRLFGNRVVLNVIKIINLDHFALQPFEE